MHSVSPSPFDCCHVCSCLEDKSVIPGIFEAVPRRKCDHQHSCEADGRQNNGKVPAHFLHFEGIAHPAENEIIVEIEIHEGKNRQVRKMFKAVGCPVQELERVAIGTIRLGHLKSGHYRKLTKEEIEYLKNC